MTIYLVVTGQPEHSLREIRKYIKCIKYLCTVCNLYKKMWCTCIIRSKHWGQTRTSIYTTKRLNNNTDIWHKGHQRGHAGHNEVRKGFCSNQGDMTDSTLLFYHHYKSHNKAGIVLMRFDSVLRKFTKAYIQLSLS